MPTHMLERAYLYEAASSQSGIAQELLAPQTYPALIERTVQQLQNDLIGQRTALMKLGAVLKARLAERFIGWDQAIRSLHPTWDERPLASILAVGPTGVGKTDTAKRLAGALFGGRLVTLHCSDAGPEARHGTAMWTGSPPGYVGSDRGGVLTDGLRAHRTAVILVDEIEKASPEAVQNILIPLMGEGTVTDRNNGETLWATDCIVFCTSNICIDHETLRAMGFAQTDENREPDDSVVFTTLCHHLLPEVVGRFNAVLCYEELDIEAQWRIWSSLRHDLAGKIGPGTRIDLDNAARRCVQDRLHFLETGARGVQDLFRELVAPLVVCTKPGETVSLTAREDGKGLRVVERSCE